MTGCKLVVSQFVLNIQPIEPQFRSLVQQIGVVRDQTCDPLIQGEWFNHNTTAIICMDAKEHHAEFITYRLKQKNKKKYSKRIFNAVFHNTEDICSYIEVLLQIISLLPLKSMH